MAELPKPARPVLRAAARLHRDHARRAVGEVLEELRRVSFRSTTSPVSISTQCSWNTRFAVSTPTTVLLVFISDPPVCP